MALGLLALPGLLLAPSGVPLDADVFDASALPAVVIDIIAPRDFAAVDLTAPMVQISGGTVQSLTKVDPAAVAVSLVIDDGPTVTPAALNDAQGASVELVRLSGDGAQISLSTPSGLQTAPTNDEEASIARISGIVAGSPDVISLPNLVLDAANRLATMPLRDRHLVVVLGTTFPDGAAVQAVRNVIIPAGIRLDVVAASGLDPGGLDELAVESGGMSPVLPNPTGEMDAIIHTISDRYHVAATVDGPGAHDVTLNVGGQAFSASVNVPGAPAVPGAAPTPTTAMTPTTVAAPSPTQAPTPTTVGGGGHGTAGQPDHHRRTDDLGVVDRRHDVIGHEPRRPHPHRAAGPRRGRRVRHVLRAQPAGQAERQAPPRAGGPRHIRGRRGRRRSERDVARCVERVGPAVRRATSAVEAARPAQSAWSPRRTATARWRPRSPPTQQRPRRSPARAGADGAAPIRNRPPMMSRRSRLKSSPSRSPSRSPRVGAGRRVEARKASDVDGSESRCLCAAARPPASAGAPAATGRRRRRRHVEAEAATVDEPEASRRGRRRAARRTRRRRRVAEVTEPEVVAARGGRHVEAPATVDEPEAPVVADADSPAEVVADAADPEVTEPEVVVAEEPAPGAIDEPSAADADVDVTDDAVAAAELGLATTRPMSGKAARRARKRLAGNWAARRRPMSSTTTTRSTSSTWSTNRPSRSRLPRSSQWSWSYRRSRSRSRSQRRSRSPSPSSSRSTMREPAIIEPAADVDIEPLPFTAAVTRTRGRSLNDRPRRVSSRRPVEPTPQPAEVVEPPEDTTPRRGRRRGDPTDRPPPERTRRGSPADLPKRARTRRRFDNIPLIDDTPPHESAIAADRDEDWLTSGDLRMQRSTGQVISHGREVSLTRPELGVLELLLRSGNDGVTPEAIKAAAGDGAGDPDAIVAQLRRKTGVRGRGQGVRKERVLLYFLGEDGAEPPAD